MRMPLQATADSRLLPSLFGALAVAVLATSCAGSQNKPRALIVDDDFPGGSVEIELVDNKRRLLRIQPADRPGRGWRCWWYFRVAGASQGESIALEVVGGDYALPPQASFSVDGDNWKKTATGQRSNNQMRYLIDAPAETFYVAWSAPFVMANANTLIDRALENPQWVQTFLLSKTLDGRDVPALRISGRKPEQGPGRVIWVQARQHAWEAGSSWVGQGFLNWLLSDDARAETLRASTTVYFVPIMDVDNVQRGAGGKNQKPHDHNRDWIEPPYFPAVESAMKMMRDFDSRGELDLFVDLHNPGAGDQEPHYHIVADSQLQPIGRTNLKDFLAASQAELTGPFVFKGKVTVSDASYDPNYKAISKNWIDRNTRDHVVAVTLETPWNVEHANPENWGKAGRQLGLAIERYLRQPRGENP